MSGYRLSTPAWAGKGTLISGVVPPPGCPVPVLTLAPQLFLGSGAALAMTALSSQGTRAQPQEGPVLLPLLSHWSFLAALNMFSQVVVPASGIQDRVKGTDANNASNL